VREPTGKQARDSTARLCKLNKKKNGKKRSKKEQERKAASTSARLRTTTNIKGKGKAVPLQAWSGPEGSRKLR
jgi:hypothetical protein